MSYLLNLAQMAVARSIEQRHIETLRRGLLVRPRFRQSYPLFRPDQRTACLYDYGPGCAVPWPDVTVVPENTDPLWQIIDICQTTWVAVRNLKTGQLIAYVPPTSVVPTNEVPSDDVVLIKGIYIPRSLAC